VQPRPQGGSRTSARPRLPLTVLLARNAGCAVHQWPHLARRRCGARSARALSAPVMHGRARGDSVSAGLSLRPEANAGIGVCRRGVSHRALATREILCQQDLRQQNFHANTHTAPARAGPLSAVMKPANRTRHLRVLKIPLTFWLVVQSLRSRRRAVAEIKRVPAGREADHSTNFYRAVGSLRRCNECIERVFTCSTSSCESRDPD